MAPSKAPTSWDDEESESSTPPSSPPLVARRGKFDDEEEEEVLESWDAAEDSEVEREKAKKAAEAKAKAEAEAKASHKSKSQRIEERRLANMRRKQEEDDDEEEDTSDDETEAERRARLRESEKQSDLKNAEDLFSNIGVSDKRAGAKPVTVQEGDDPASTIDLSKLKLFSPASIPQFTALRETLVPLLAANSKKPQYAIFLEAFVKQISKDLNSEQVKKIATGLSTMSNEKMREEKAAEKGGKKTKAAKSKATLTANRDVASKADITAYDDGLEE